MIRSKNSVGVKCGLMITCALALLILAFHLCPGIVAPTHAQGSRKDDIVFNSRGIPLAGATVRVCAMPASGQPCTPLAQIYSDPALTQALANPTTTDGLGNYFFYAAPGKYEIELSGPGITTKQLPNVILPNDPASPTFSSVSSTGAISALSLSLTGNLTVNGNTSVLGNLASGTLNLTNQSTPPGAAASGTVNLYTKTVDKKLYYKDDTGSEQGPLGAGAQTNATNTFTAAQNFDADIHTKGPNPWFDLARYGGYSATSPPSTTGSISSASATLTLANAQDFANGQGIVVYQAGPATSLTRPGQPTITPTNLTGGSTSYNYQVIAEDRLGGLTAASNAGATTTGAATLGANSITLTSCERTNGVATYTSSANHNLQAGAQIAISGFGSFGTLCTGAKTVASTPTSTTFTTNDAPANSLNNETNNAGGTATVIACNTLTFASGSFSGNNTMRYWIYRSISSGAYSLAGIALGMDPWFQDCGAGAPTAPSYVPSTPPGSPQNQYLATTITSGGGTTTLTLANAAGNTVTNQAVLHDNAVPLKNAITAASNANGGTVYIPNGGNNTIWPFNSTMDTTGLFSRAVRIHLNGTVSLAQPWILTTNADVEGEPHAATTFQYVNTTQILGAANPQFLIPAENNNGVHLKQLLLQAQSNQQVAILSDGGGDGGGNTGLVFEDLNINTGPLGPGLIIKGGFDFFIDRGTCATNGATLFNGGSCARLTNVSPAVAGGTPTQIPGSLRFNQWYMAGNAVQVDCLPNSFAQAASRFEFRNLLFESTVAPFLRVVCPSDTFGLWYLTNVTTADVLTGVGTPLIDANVHGFGEVYCEGCDSAAGNPPFLIEGNPNPIADQVVLTNTNYGNPGNTTYTYTDSGLNTNSIAIANLLEYPMGVPGAPSAAVTSGGNVPIATHSYQVQFLDVNGNFSAASQGATAVTTTGNQTVTITRPAPPLGATGWYPYRDGARVNIPGCNTPLLIATASFADTASFTCGQSESGGTAGVATLSSSGLSGQALTLVDPNNSGFTAKTNFPNALTANRTISMPDANLSFETGSGPVVLAQTLQSAYDNFNRANGAIGSNWTVTQNSLSVTSNVIQGGTGGHNTAYWSAVGASAFTPAQFSEATITALNGTTDFPGITVLFSGSGATTQGYMCFEDTTQIILEKMTAGSGSTLASASTTGAVGDVLRLEVAPGGVLTCYKNGVSTLTFTDTTYTTGSPGLDLFGNVATMDNWSGGNLHALAHLDLDQDWAKTQHFVQGIAVNGETLSASPRSEQNVFLPGALTSTWTGSTWTLDKAVTVTRVQIQAKTAPSGCATNAVVRLTDGTTPVNLTISAAANDSGAIAQNYAVGAAVTVSVQTAAVGCTTSPADANVVVQYRMQ